MQALYLANRERAGVTLDHVDLGFRARATRGDAEEQTLQIYKGAKVIAGTSLWIPSKSFIDQLKASGSITSGSTHLTQAWDTANDAVGTAVDVTRYGAGVIVGVLEGAYSAIVDLFRGAADMLEAVLEVLWHLVTGNPGLIKDMVMAWADKMKQAWERRGDIADEFLRKWNAESPWDRGRFQGEVLGWVMMTVLLILLTLGHGAPAALSGITLRWPQLINLLKTVDTLGDVTTYLGVAARATKLPGAAADYLAGKLAKASRSHGQKTGDKGASAPRAEGMDNAADPVTSKELISSPAVNKSSFITVAGYAQHPKTHPWLKNASGAVRSLEEAVEIARKNGVEIPDDVALRKVSGKFLPDYTYAEYFRGRTADPTKTIKWDDFYNRDLDQLLVRVEQTVFESDEAIVAIISHEMHELNNLRRLFEESGGTMTYRRLYYLISPGIKGNLHDQAWDVADRHVAAMRRTRGAST